MNETELCKRLDKLIKMLSDVLPPASPATLDSPCYRWGKIGPGINRLIRETGWQPPDVEQLVGLNGEIDSLRANTAAFAQGKKANHALLTGPRGCGKTTIVQGVVGEFAGNGLAAVLVTKEDLASLQNIAAAAAGRGIKLILCCDELSFPGDLEGLLGAKKALDYLDVHNCEMLLYATSNRRHLVAERHSENLEASHDISGEIHPGETTEEKISLSDRFGLWLPVFAPGVEGYADLAEHWLRLMGMRRTAKLRYEALQWARERGSHNGRTAKQFAIHTATVAGRK